MPIKIVTSQDFDFEPIPEGVYKTLITKVVEKEEFNRFQNEKQLGFQVEFTIQEGELKGKKAYKFFTPFLTSNSKLTSVCKAVMGREFTVEELASIQGIEQLHPFLAGKPVTILVKTRVSGRGKTYYSIKDFLTLKGESTAPSIDYPQPKHPPAPQPARPASNPTPVTPVIPPAPVVPPAQPAPPVPPQIQSIKEPPVQVPVQPPVPAPKAPPKAKNPKENTGKMTKEEVEQSMKGKNKEKVAPEDIPF